jgi:hypothetical protein
VYSCFALRKYTGTSKFPFWAQSVVNI